jgi:hypothetical protein
MDERPSTKVTLYPCPRCGEPLSSDAISFHDHTGTFRPTEYLSRSAVEPLLDALEEERQSRLARAQTSVGDAYALHMDRASTIKQVLSSTRAALDEGTRDG